MPEDIYKQDRFYVNLERDEIVWMYHNPDAISGDQFVSNHFDIDLLEKAIRECDLFIEKGHDMMPIFHYIGDQCRQFLSDVGTLEYDYDKEIFESEPFAIGMSQSTIDKLMGLFKSKDVINNPSSLKDLQYMKLDSCGETYETCIEFSTYLCGGGISLEILDITDHGLEPYAPLTVNIPESRANFGCAFVDTNNFSAAEKLIKDYKLGTPTGHFARSGFCTYPEYRFNLNEIKKHCINPEDIKKFKMKERGYER